MVQDVLIVDDEADIRTLLAGILEDEGFRARQAKDADSCLQALQVRQPNLVVLDIWLEGSRLDGLEILEVIVRDHPGVPVVMISGHGTIEMAVNAIQLGAYDFIEKPFKTDRLIVSVQRAIEAMQLQRQVRELKVRAGMQSELTGRSSAVGTARQAIEKAAPTGSRVLISGPAGSGKEVAARMLHRHSRRHNGSFLVLNCATMQPERLERELFGSEIGSAKGGGRLIGVLERAHGGTLLLDEVGDLPKEVQGRLVRVLQDRRFERIGGKQPVEVDVRIISTTGRDLPRLIEDGRFREDLFYRLNVVPIAMPALKERREDIPELVEELMAQAAEVSGRPPRRISVDAMTTLQAYDWPGNIRQLRNVIEWLLIMAPGGSGEAITAEQLPPEVAADGPTTLRSNGDEDIMALPLRDARELFERQYLEAQLLRFGNNISRTANFVGMERSALHRKLRTLGIQAER